MPQVITFAEPVVLCHALGINTNPIQETMMSAPIVPVDILIVEDSLQALQTISTALAFEHFIAPNGRLIDFKKFTLMTRRGVNIGFAPTHAIALAALAVAMPKTIFMDQDLGLGSEGIFLAVDALHADAAVKIICISARKAGAMLNKILTNAAQGKPQMKAIYAPRISEVLAIENKAEFFEKNPLEIAARITALSDQYERAGQESVQPRITQPRTATL